MEYRNEGEDETNKKSNIIQSGTKKEYKKQGVNAGHFMAKGNWIYKGINLVELIYCIILFWNMYEGIGIIIEKESTEWKLILLLTSGCVLGIKMFRLYIILFGRNLSFFEHLKQYCKAVPVSILFPFKMGEIFRMYCYGYQMGDYADGIICILLDRFVDTMALVTIMIGIHWIFGMKASFLLYILLFFLVCVFIVYNIFKLLYVFWKDYFISSVATKRKIKALAFLETCNNAYSSISKTVKGKFVILYILSLIVWGIEIGGMLILSSDSGIDGKQDLVFEYLTSALTGSNNVYMRQFSTVSIVFMLATYLILQCCISVKSIRRRYEKHE